MSTHTDTHTQICNMSKLPKSTKIGTWLWKVVSTPFSQQHLLVILAGPTSPVTIPGDHALRNSKHSLLCRKQKPNFPKPGSKHREQRILHTGRSHQCSLSASSLILQAK